MAEESILYSILSYPSDREAWPRLQATLCALGLPIETCAALRRLLLGLVLLGQFRLDDAERARALIGLGGYVPGAKKTCTEHLGLGKACETRTSSLPPVHTQT